MTAFSDQFTTTQVGNLFMMRLAGFIRDHDARLLRIDEQSAKLELGGRSFFDWLWGREYVERTCIDLAFLPLEQESPADPTTRLSVAVSVRPTGIGSREFDRLARVVLSEVRGYFAAV